MLALLVLFLAQTPAPAPTCLDWGPAKKPGETMSFKDCRKWGRPKREIATSTALTKQGNQYVWDGIVYKTHRLSGGPEIETLCKQYGLTECTLTLTGKSKEKP